LRAFSTTRAAKASAIDSMARMRLTAVQRWPEFFVAPATAS